MIENNQPPNTENAQVINSAQEQSPIVVSKSKLKPLVIIGSIVLIIVLLLSGGFFILNNYIRQQELKPNLTTSKTLEPSPTPDSTANWKTFTDSEHDFSFKYAPDWNIEDNCFYDSKLCLSITSFSNIPLEENYRGTMGGRVTRESYFEAKQSIDQGKIPLVGVGDNEKIVKVNGMNVLQSLGYGDCCSSKLDVQHFLINSEFFSDREVVAISSNLPIQAIPRKDSNDSSGLRANIEKATKVSSDIEKGIYESKKLEDAVKKYKMILSTFKFKDQNQTGGLGDFPIYTVAKFVNNELNKCYSAGPLEGHCYDEYNFEVTENDSFYKVYHWYEDSLRSGWKCGPGGGGFVDDSRPSSGSTITACYKDKLNYRFYFSGNTKSSTIKVGVPTK